MAHGGEAPRWRRYLRFWGSDPASDVESEFSFHMQERIEELVAMGMDERAARLEAERGFGDMAQVKSTCSSLAMERERSMKRLEQWSVVRQDVTFAIRQLRAQRLLTIAVLVTLAVGIGATTAIFSVVNAVLLRPLPYADGDRIVILWETWREFTQGRASPGHYHDWKEQSNTLEATAAATGRSYTLTGDVAPERVPGLRVTPDYFRVFNMPPAAGRYFLPEEAEARVVVLSHELWQSRFGGEASIVGRDVVLNGEAHTVVGVTPRGYRLVDSDEQLWTPLSFTAEDRANYGSHSWLVFAKARPGVTMEGVRADIARVTEGIRERVPGMMQERGVNVGSYADTLVADHRTQLLVLLGAVLSVLLIACGNVASLLLARATTRRKELAVRSALGGGRGRLVRQLLTESLVLAVIGGAAGVLLAYWGVGLLQRVAPRTVPRLQEAGLQPDVLLFAVVATLLCGLIFGLAPALRATRTDLQSVLRQGGRSSNGGAVRDRLRATLITGEIAVALVLLVAAALFVRSAMALSTIPLGFEDAGLTVGRLSLPTERYPDNASVTTAYRQVMDRLAAQPEVAQVAAGSRIPLWGGSPDGTFRAEGQAAVQEESRVAHLRAVTPRYFDVLGIPLRGGREFGEADLAESAATVVIINETLARDLFGEENAVGKRITPCCSGTPAWLEVVGVAADTRAFGREEEAPPEIFLPYTHAPDWLTRGIIIVARGKAGADLPPALRAAVAGVDPALPLYDAQPLSSVVAEAGTTRRFSMLLLAVLGITGLVLAALGIYGVVGFFVTQRTQEIGVRMALGATSQDVLRLVMLHGGRLTAIGILIGAAASLAATRVLSSMLVGVTALDPVAFVAGAAVLAAAALLAALVPALRAARVQPVRSLTGS